jgi:hypothetical protein
MKSPKLLSKLFLANVVEPTAWLCTAAPLPLHLEREKEGEVKDSDCAAGNALLKS